MAAPDVTPTTVLTCGHLPTRGTTGGTGGTGYGLDAEGNTYCYACCADRDRADMLATGRATLYLSGPHPDAYSLTAWRVSNWPGTLAFRCPAPRKGKHNVARTRYDVWFTGPDGAEWHGVQYGEWTQLVHCRRVKGRSR